MFSQIDEFNILRKINIYVIKIALLWWDLPTVLPAQ
jgi:hypothetical protein